MSSGHARPPSQATDVNSGVVYKSTGPVPNSTREEAKRMVEKLKRLAPRPVIFSRVKVRVDENRDSDEQSVVQGTIDVSGSIVRAQAAAGTPRQALGIVGDRLERRLGRLAERREQANERPHSTPPGEWRHGDLPSKRPNFYDRPPRERRIVRRKTFAPDEAIPVSEAVFDLDVLDYRFFLFTNESGGQTAVVYESGGDVALQTIDGSPPSPDVLDAPLRVNETPAPQIDVDEAITLLNSGDEPFVFFKDRSSDRASVLYRRYDGHYGLVVSTRSEA